MFDISHDIKLNKTLDELTLLQQELNEKDNKLKAERVRLLQLTRQIDNELKQNNDSLQIIMKEINRLEVINNMKDYNLKNIEDIDILAQDELDIIIKNMDQRDYRKYGNYSRFRDLEKLVKRIVAIKKQYINWTLIDLKYFFTGETEPPRISYVYKFKDSNNNVFSV